MKRMRATTRSISLHTTTPVCMGTWHTNESVTPESLKTLDNDLADLPSGLHKFAGVEFDVRGVIQLDGQTLREEGGKYPERVDGIPVNRKIYRMHVLHAAGWQAPKNAVIGAYVLHYADGSQKEFEIVYGKHVLDWWRYDDLPLDPENTQTAWTGFNDMARNMVDSGPEARIVDGANRLLQSFGLSKLSAQEVSGPLRLFKTAWDNPQPDIEVESIDYVSKMTDSAPFLIAITVE